MLPKRLPKPAKCPRRILLNINHTPVKSAPCAAATARLGASMSGVNAAHTQLIVRNSRQAGGHAQASRSVIAALPARASPSRMPAGRFGSARSRSGSRSAPSSSWPAGRWRPRPISPSATTLKGLIARQAEQQFAYEDRIAELRAQIDRTTSRQLLDQEQFEQKLDDLMRRQSTLESARGRRWPASPIRPRPVRCVRPRVARHADSVTGATGAVSRGYTAGDPKRISARACPASKRRSTASNGGEAAALAQVEERYDGKARMLRGVLAELGLKTRWAAPGRHRRPIRSDQAAGRRQRLRARTDAASVSHGPKPTA